MLITAQHVLNHKALTVLLKVHTPVENQATWINIKNKKVHGKRTTTIDINADWTKATVCDIDTFPDCKHITYNIYDIKSRITSKFDHAWEHCGYYFLMLPAAHKNSQHSRNPYQGCGSSICSFCNEFKATGTLPSVLPEIPPA
jgi:hypothetical protein